MQSITTIGLDIAKSVFQVHGVDAGGQVVVRRQLKRRYGDHEIPRAASLWIKQLQAIHFSIECTAGKTPDREENALLLIQSKAIRHVDCSTVTIQKDSRSQADRKSK